LTVTEISPAEAIFFAALAKADPAERTAYLDAACGGDAELRRCVDRLLAAHPKVGRFLEQPAAEPCRTGAYHPPLEADAPAGVPSAAGGTGQPGVALAGRYKLLQQIGEGGMGAVWMAEQTQPVQRRVALKVVKPGMDSKQVLARFEAERQALALMDHPNIAKVLDAGTTEGGRPYFVMELVKGVPINQYCDEHKLTPRQRLELFVPVCQAVQHAHNKGVIHRDLKPSNVLVALYDGVPVPKIIDFGIAKAVGQKLTEKTLFTEFGAVVGTLEYMSPEQAELNQLDIDTRSDIYSLGVLLYELLTDTTPLERKRLKESGLLEALRLIREEEPPKPSTRLNTSKERAAVAANRGLEPARLSGLVRGELDWIVMKCLEKHRDLRYETANSLTLDLQRYLRDEPVQACPPSAAYRLQKLVRRYKRALAMAGVVLAGLVLAVVGLVVSTVLTWQAKQQVDQALAREVRSGYFQRIALADREGSANNLARADELLASCPAELRGWEWRYLERLRGKPSPPLRHDNAVFACAVSPDGRLIVSGDLGGLLKVWDLDTGQEVRPAVKAHETGCNLVAFSPDGRHFATGDDDRVNVWNTRTGELLRTWKGPPGCSLQGVAFAPGGALLACTTETVNGRDEARIWDLWTGACLFGLPGHDDEVASIAISPDGKLLASAGLDRTVRTWDLATGEPRRAFRGAIKFRGVQFSPDGRLLAAVGGTMNEQGIGAVKIWDLATGAERPVAASHPADCLAFSPDSQRLATAGNDQTVKVWDTLSGQEVISLGGHRDWVRGVAFSPDGHRLVSASLDHTVRVWDGRPMEKAPLQADTVLTLRGHGNSVNALAFHPTQPRLVTAGADGNLKVWDTATGRELRTLSGSFGSIWGVDFSPDGRFLAAGGGGDSAILLDAETGAKIRQIGRHDGLLTSVAFSSDGRRLATGGTDGGVMISDVSTGAVLHHLAVGGWGVRSVTFSPDAGGRLLAAGGNDGRVWVWDAATGAAVGPSRLQHRLRVASVAFGPDGCLLASGGADQTVRLWAAGRWEQVEMVADAVGDTGHGLAFSPDGRLLAWGGNHGTVRVWNRATGEIHTLSGHRNWISAVAFSPNGKLLASASQDGTARIWPSP
jgi:WD40 repeat protein/tRNA A-37 threonylcarbamoyl transferase component Bud32